MEHHSFTSLMIVVAVAFMTPILLQRFRLRVIPVVVAEIMAGLLIGKTGFNLVQEDLWLELLSLLGFIFLMFLSGLEIDFSFLDPQGLKENSGQNPLKTALLLFCGIMGVSFLLSHSLVRFGLIKEPFLMTLIISTISLGVVVPVLKENRLTETGFGQTILLLTVLSDFTTMILLAVYVAVQSQQATQILLLLLFFMLVFLAYRFIKRYVNIPWFEQLLQGTIQLGTRGVFALILLFVALSESLGVEYILGAFLAGLIVSILSPSKELVHQLDSIGFGFLIPIFFVMVGVNLDLIELFKNPKVLVFIPLLLLYMYLAKLVPVLLLKRWYPWKQVIGIGILVTSKLSLVIAAAAVALKLGFINAELQGALILVSVLTCLISPVVFSKLFPKPEVSPKRISVIGSNSITLPTSQDLKQEGYQVTLFEVGASSAESLHDEGAFDADIVIIGSSEDEMNIQLAYHAQAAGVKQVILRVENPERSKGLKDDAFSIFSTSYATRTLVKALVEYPSAIKLLTDHDDSIQEVRLGNPQFHLAFLRKLPCLEGVLILRIYRGDTFVIPHGNTILYMGDSLLVTGSVDDIERFKENVQ